ncbi:MAG TPA: hypothetical protein VF972_10070 [Actinomycetota bacterium]
MTETWMVVTPQAGQPLGLFVVASGLTQDTATALAADQGEGYQVMSATDFLSRQWVVARLKLPGRYLLVASVLSEDEAKAMAESDPAYVAMPLQDYPGN